MSVVSALRALELKRCEGVADGRHYAFGAVVPDIVDGSALVWRYDAGVSDLFKAENYDVRSGVLFVGVSMTVLLGRYTGIGGSDLVAALPLWIDRALAMVGDDLLLGDSLSVPLSGVLRRAGVLDWQRRRYVGLLVAYSLPVRIVAL